MNGAADHTLYALMDSDDDGAMGGRLLRRWLTRAFSAGSEGLVTGAPRLGGRGTMADERATARGASHTLSRYGRPGAHRDPHWLAQRVRQRTGPGHA